MTHPLQTVKDGLEQILRMNTVPDHFANTATLVAAHTVARRGLEALTTYMGQTGSCTECERLTRESAALRDAALQFPEHKASLHLTHNQHKDYYETITEYTSRDEDDCWISEAQKAKAIETNELWELQWYPDTPVGFYKIYAADLSELLKHAAIIKQIEGE